MTTLSDKDLEKLLEEKAIRIEPFCEENLKPASYDLTVGRVLGGEAKEDTKLLVRRGKMKEERKVYYEIQPGGSVIILTAEKIALNNHVAGHVNLMNRRAIKGMELLNPGHIDPGWGCTTTGEKVGSELTAVIRNVSNEPVKLSPKDEFLTIVFDKLETPAERRFKPAPQFVDPTQRVAYLEVEAQRIRKFVELQKNIQDQLKEKLSYKEVLESLGLLTATLGLVITFVVAFVATTSAPTQVSINGFMVDRSVLLFALGFLLTVIVIIASVWRKKKTV